MTIQNYMMREAANDSCIKSTDYQPHFQLKNFRESNKIFLLNLQK
jgi:hypothetical protein